MATVRFLQAGACLALLLTVAGAARAQTHSSARIDNFRYELIDLDPADNLAPSLTLTLTSLYGESGLYAGSFSFPITQASTAGFGEIDVGSANGNASAALTQDYDSGATADALAYSSRSGTRLDLQFTLSPYTRAIFSADASVSAQPQLGLTYAEAGLHGEITTPFISHGTRFDALYYANLGDEAGVLSAVANAGADPATGTLSLRTSASSDSLAPPVPEPPALAMLAAGLLVAGGAARLRR